MELLPCPCCRGESIYADLQVGDTLMWQVSCTSCGLSSALDEDKEFTAECWNLRQESSRGKMWITTLAAVLPAAIVIFFLLGILAGMGMFS